MRPTVSRRIDSQRRGIRPCHAIESRGWPVFSENNESACKPGSVWNGHPSRAHVTARLSRPTRKSPCRQHGSRNWNDFPIWPCTGWGLPCRRRHRRRGALLPHHFTLTRLSRAVYFLWHFPWAHAPQALPGTLPYGARTFLCRPPVSGSDRSADSQEQDNILTTQTTALYCATTQGTTVARVKQASGRSTKWPAGNTGGPPLQYVSRLIHNGSIGYCHRCKNLVFVGGGYS